MIGNLQVALMYCHLHYDSLYGLCGCHFDMYCLSFMYRKDHELDELYASISDDSKEQAIGNEQSNDSGEWYNHLMIQDLQRMSLSECQLMTVAMACQSPPAIHQLLDSGLPTVLTHGILGAYDSEYLLWYAMFTSHATEFNTMKH